MSGPPFGHYFTMPYTVYGTPIRLTEFVADDQILQFEGCAYMNTRTFEGLKHIIESVRPARIPWWKRNVVALTPVGIATVIGVATATIEILRRLT